MARAYTDQDRARVYLALEGNDGNVKRTSRDTGVAEQTVRDWKKKREREGLPESVEAALPAVRAEFLDDASRVRNKALGKLEQEIDAGNMKGRDLVVAVGVLHDKIRAAEAKPSARTEDSGGAIPVADVRELFRGLAQGLVDAAEDRAATISVSVDGDANDVEEAEQAEEVPFLALAPPPSEQEVYG